MRISEQSLRRDMETLNMLLDEMIEEQAGGEQFGLVEGLRRLAQERRAELPGAEEHLVRRIHELSEEDTRVVVKALSIFFDLANLAEDCHRIRVIRQRERESQADWRSESIGEAVGRLKRDGFTAEKLQQLLDRLSIQLVFTAHPTEAKRRTTRRLLRRLRTHLKQWGSEDLLPGEQQWLLEQMSGVLTILWQSDLLRPRRPEVLDEVKRGLFFVEGLWEVLPQVCRDMRKALEASFPGHRFRLKRFLRFGSWIGGDRDGNPNVTTGVTAESLTLLRRAALERHLTLCRELLPIMAMSERQVPLAPQLKQAVEQARQRWPELDSRLDGISEAEVYRRWMHVLQYRLERALAAPPFDFSDDGGYRLPGQLEADLQLLARSVSEHQGQRIVDCHIQDWLDRLHTFGFHLAELDIRQESQVHTEVLTEVFRHLELAEDYAAQDEREKQQLLERAMGESPKLVPGEFSEQTHETLSLFQLLVRAVQAYGIQVLGGHVISMTHQVSDVLAVLLLWKWAWTHSGEQSAEPVYLPIVPLFETIDDLQRAPEVLEALLAHPDYTAYLHRSQPPAQMVMVGYSDSTKDGGYLAAGWSLHRAQEQLAEVAGRHGVRLEVFHGRGGALGRGGGPAARAVLSLPSQAVGGVLRMTEQGEVLAERYDDPQIAYRHLEQVTWATMLVSGEEAPPTEPRWIETMENLAQRSFQHYRRLVEDPGFLTFFDQATPISEIERLPIGSRPARRRQRRSLANLRAIPWTFAWTQCRQLLPAWFGLGTAVNSMLDQAGGNWTLLQQMYDRWMLFRALVDNADLALVKADMAIAHRYAELLEDHQAEQRIWQMIAHEYALSRGAVLMITRQPDLLGDTPWLQRSVQERNPYVDPLNFIQVELIRRLQAQPDAEGQSERLRDLLRLTIQGIAAGLRTTG